MTMGTNFYTASGTHLGKRSAAGLYCWDCGVTLCKRGEAGIHDSASEWYDSCPKCGAKKQKETLNNSTAGRELGFNHNPPARKSGVSSCCSFTWARPLGKVRKIVDEYGEEYTREEFERVLEECPVQYKLYGVEFS